MMKINRNSKGFTLIELLIVVAIIGILAAIAIPAYTGYTKKAKLAGVVHALGAVKNAICAYYTETSDGNIPAAADIAAINSTYGVEPTTQYATFAVTTGGVAQATITGTPVASLGVSGTLVLSTTDMKTWSWSNSTVEAQYRPKD
jgi:type IV pilus assembly protein PilA